MFLHLLTNCDLLFSNQSLFYCNITRSFLNTVVLVVLYCTVLYWLSIYNCISYFVLNLNILPMHAKVLKKLFFHSVFKDFPDFSLTLQGYVFKFFII